MAARSDEERSTEASAAALAERIWRLPMRKAVVRTILEHSFKWARDEILANPSLDAAEMNYQGRLGLVVLAHSVEAERVFSARKGSAAARKSARGRTAARK
jgi:hypothetical protein